MTPFDAIFVPERYRDAVSDAQWVGRMLDFERALATAEAEAGVVPAGHAEAIVEQCRTELFDAVQLAEAGRAGGNPADPLVRRLRAAVGGQAASFVHFGATSQDVVDTAAMLVAAQSIDLLLDDLDGLGESIAALARAHRATPIAGRTLLQQAVPTTFGAKCAGWLVALVDSRAALRYVRRERLAVQFGGAAGTLGPLGEAGPRVLALLAAELMLREPVVPWHTDRTRVAEVGSALGLVAGVTEKIGFDVALLAQTEVGEVVEVEGGGSSSMPQKRNPTGAIVAGACARLVRGHVGVLMAAMGQEHERAAGAWHSEWAALSAALAFCGGAVSATRRSLDGLVVDTDRMRANLELTGGAIVAERVAIRLAGELGREAAHDAIAAATSRASSSGETFREALLADASLGLDPAELDDLLDPAAYLGSAEAFVDRALEKYEVAHEEEGKGRPA